MGNGSGNSGAGNGRVVLGAGVDGTNLIRRYDDDGAELPPRYVAPRGERHSLSIVRAMAQAELNGYGYVLVGSDKRPYATRALKGAGVQLLEQLSRLDGRDGNREAGEEAAA